MDTPSSSTTGIVGIEDGLRAVYICQYSNGHFTSAGLRDEVFPDPGTGPVLWHSSAAIHLPVEWPDMLWEDDNGKKQKMHMVLFDSCAEDEDVDEPVFLMEDGTLSWTVKEVMR